MKLKLNLHTFTIKLKEPFTISRGTYSERKTLIVELVVDKKSGFGEALEHEYYGITIDKMLTKVESIRGLIENFEFEKPTDFWDFLNPYLSVLPFLQNAIDCAAHDLYGKLQEQPAHKLWGLSSDISIKSSYTLGINEIDKIVEQIESTDFDIYKIKLGTPKDIAIMTALAEHSTAKLRVDVNTAWSVQQTIDNSKLLKELGVEFIEQPIKADDWEGMKTVQRYTELPIIADEACVSEEDVQKCAISFDGINIKLMKCGGLTPALRMITNAKELGLKVMCGCMMETSIGISAIAQLVPLLDYVDMDSTLLIENDPAQGAIVMKDGSIKLPKTNGLGITINF